MEDNISLSDFGLTCEVFDNCRNNADCTWCLKGTIKPQITYIQYLPKNRKILSPPQIKAKEDKRLAKKALKNSDPHKRGKANKRKGYTAERKIAKLTGGTRVPLSGALGGNLSNDVIIPTMAGDLGAEVKARDRGYTDLIRWLSDTRECPDCVVIAVDNQKPIICFFLDNFMAKYGKENGE